MSPLAESMVAALKATPLYFHELADAHGDVPWRAFLRAWGEIRAADILKRHQGGHYYVEP